MEYNQPFFHLRDYTRYKIINMSGIDTNVQDKQVMEALIFSILINRDDAIQNFLESDICAKTLDSYYNLLNESLMYAYKQNFVDVLRALFKSSIITKDDLILTGLNTPAYHILNIFLDEMLLKYEEVLELLQIEILTVEDRTNLMNFIRNNRHRSDYCLKNSSGL